MLAYTATQIVAEYNACCLLQGIHNSVWIASKIGAKFLRIVLPITCENLILPPFFPLISKPFFRVVMADIFSFKIMSI